MSKYVIRITRRLPGTQMKDGGRGEMHYYHVRLKEGTSYEPIEKFDKANAFTEQEVKKITKEIVTIYEEYDEVIVGKLLKIEVMNIKTLDLVSMCGFKPDFEPEVVVSRFELMEL